MSDRATAVLTIAYDKPGLISHSREDSRGTGGTEVSFLEAESFPLQDGHSIEPRAGWGHCNAWVIDRKCLCQNFTGGSHSNWICENPECRHGFSEHW